MSISSKLKTLFRGDIAAADLGREFVRRRNAAAFQRSERENLGKLHDAQARLLSDFASLSPHELLEHFRSRVDPGFWPVDLAGITKLQSEVFPADTTNLIDSANSIVRDSKWELAGFGLLEFKGENFWRKDPFNEKDWGTDYHADVAVYSNDGADIRVLWELNRFGHAITIALSFAVTGDETYAETFFSHVESWMRQNPYGRGANWNCAMEVALRAINLVAAFDIFRASAACTEERLMRLLQLFDQHGRFIVDNNEFSYIATSNHYLSDVIGLFWIGIMLPELDNAKEWRDLGLSEMLREMDKQILPDGADFEASTGYHKFAAEMLLYTFLLARRNGTEIAERYWLKLSQMLEYINGIMRPDGRVPLIGDADGSQIVPVVRRDADDQAYLLALGAVVFERPDFKVAGQLSLEVLWLLGENSTTNEALEAQLQISAAFPDAGSYVMRDGDLYLHFNTNDCGVNGRGSHAHNDALSIEVSAQGRAFIIDPGSYVYNLDRDARQMFRSTAYHSTVTVDGAEQNTCVAGLPFVMGNEARPKVLAWETSDAKDRVSAEHYGYLRLSEPILHRRTIEFYKAKKYWHIEDILDGKGAHEFGFSFHLAPGLSVSEIDGGTMQLGDERGGSLLIHVNGLDGKAEIINASRSMSYGHIEDTQILRWKVMCKAPLTVTFLLVPVAADERLETRLALVRGLTQNIGS